MSPNDAIRLMMKKSKINPTELSRRIGKSRAYISSSLAHDSTPKVDTLARIAHECGYRMYLRSGDDEIELYSEDDKTASIQDFLSHLPATVNVEDLIKEMKDSQMLLTVTETGPDGKLKTETKYIDKGKTDSSDSEPE